MASLASSYGAKAPPPPGDLPAGELSVAATLVAGDAQRQNRMVPVRWADAPRSDGDSPLLRLFVNSRRAEKVTASAGPGTRSVECKRVSARSVRRYDTICELDLPRRPAESGPHSVTVTRRGGRRDFRALAAGGFRWSGRKLWCTIDDGSMNRSGS